MEYRILCHNINHRRSGRRHITFLDLSSVEIAIICITHAESVFKLTLGQDLLGTLKLILLNNPLQEPLFLRKLLKCPFFLRNEAPVRYILYGNVKALVPFNIQSLKNI